MREISVYIHFPWCQRKCPYCDFATQPGQSDSIPHEAYADQVIKELSWRSDDLRDQKLVSIFLGGGTPSLWAAPSIARVLKSIRSTFRHSADEVEVTVECNPISLRRDWLQEVADAGVNRASIGVQSTRDEDLRFLGRLHDSSRAAEAIQLGSSILDRVSADLMFGMPNQSTASLLDGIDQLIDLGVKHVSAYSLTVEPATRFGTLQRAGKLKLASEDEFATLFLKAREQFARRGFEHYEVSNYATAGETSRHNQHYWRGGTYLGLGAAAVGCLPQGPGQARRYRNVPTPRRYLEAGLHKELIEESNEDLSPQDLIREALMLGLRTQEGVNLDITERRAGVEVIRGRESSWERRVKSGDLVVANQVATVPRHRWLHLDSIVADLF